MPDRKQKHIGPFPAFMAADARAGRFQPESFAKYAGIDPATAQKYLKGTLPVPATLLVSLIEYTRNTVYVDTLLDRLGLTTAPKAGLSEVEGLYHEGDGAGGSESSEYGCGGEQIGGCSDGAASEPIDFDDLKDSAVELVGDAALLQRAINTWMDGPAKLSGMNQAAARSWLLSVVRHAASISRMLTEDGITESLGKVADVLTGWDAEHAG